MSEDIDEPTSSRDRRQSWTQIQIDIAVVKEVVLQLKDVSQKISERFEDVVFRNEYNPRHEELRQHLREVEVIAEKALADARDLRVEARVWRFVFTSAIAVLSTVIIFVHTK